METCKNCGKKFKSQRYYTEHTKKCNVEKNIKCLYCELKFDTERSLSMHIKQKHLEYYVKKNKEKNIGQFKCEKCDKIFTYKKQYEKHIKDCSFDKEKHLYCEICDIKFESSQSYAGHIATKHSKNSINSKSNYTCKICNQTFHTNKGAFTNHVKNHNDAWRKSKGEKISESWKELLQNEEKRTELSNFRSEYMKENNPMYNENNIEKMKLSQREYFENMTDEEYSKLVENFINAPKKGNSVNHSGKYTPTKIEQMVIDLNIDGLEYNGNKKNSKTIRFKNKNYKHSSTPDFIYKDNKKFIETFGVYRHPKEDEDIYKNAFNENGYEVLILWEDELYNNFEECEKRIYNFLQNKKDN